MALFSKKTCCRCGRESRLMASFQSRNGSVHLCDKCKAELHVEGYVDYALYVLRKNATYEELMDYSAYYDGVMEEAKTFRECNYPVEMAVGAELLSEFFKREFGLDRLNGSVSFGNYRLNALYLSSHQYKDLVLRRSEVYLAAVSTDYKSSNKHSGYDFVTCMLFSRSDIMPAFPTLFMQPESLFDLLKTKAKKETMMLLTQLYPTAKIEEAKNVRKQLRSGELQGCGDQKCMEDLLHAVQTNSGCCKGETMLNDRTKYMRSAAQHDLQMGFYVPKDEF